jgi:homoserine O-succinyltransferase/O-acetyltransferase
MPAIIPRELPAYEELKKEGVFVMDENRAATQDIRPLEIGIFNMMPNKAVTETQFIRMISGGALQVRPILIRPITHQTRSEDTAAHLDNFYKDANRLYDPSLPREEQIRLDGLIITGAPFEGKELEDIDFYPELLRIMQWARECRFHSIFLLGGADRAL